MNSAISGLNVLFDGQLNEDVTNCELPSVEPETMEINVGLGKIEMPLSTQIKPMSCKVSFKTGSRSISGLSRPGVQNIEFRFYQDCITADLQHRQEGTKIFIAGIHKKSEKGKLESGASMEPSIEYEVLRYREVVDGIETVLIDKINFVYKINGIDYLKNARTILGR